MHVERTFTVARPVAEVFAYLGDFTTTTAWDPGTRRTERTSGDGGLGTTYDNASEFMGRQVELVYTTITYQPPSAEDPTRPARVQFRGINGRSTGTDSMTFTALDDDSTSIHYRADFTFGPLVKLVAPFVVGRRLDALADETIARIRECLEA